MRNATPKSLDARMTPKHSHVRPPVRAAFPVADAVCGSTRATADDSAVGTVEGSPALKPARVRARVCPPLSREFPRRSHLQLCRALRAVNGSRDLFFIFRLPLKQRLYPLGPRSARPRRTPTVGCCSVSTACAPPIGVRIRWFELRVAPRVEPSSCSHLCPHHHRFSRVAFIATSATDDLRDVRATDLPAECIRWMHPLGPPRRTRVSEVREFSSDATSSHRGSVAVATSCATLVATTGAHSGLFARRVNSVSHAARTLWRSGNLL